jgi:hypothetical protein
MVPADWQHPKKVRKDWRGVDVERFIPLFPGDRFAPRAADWDEEFAKWQTGWRPDYFIDDGTNLTYEKYAGARPVQSDYMPDWPAEQRTHLMMYEDTSEGTPISPAFATPEELARWLADNNASSFGGATASYEQWLRVARGGWAPSMVLDARGLRSGVEAISD